MILIVLFSVIAMDGMSQKSPAVQYMEEINSYYEGITNNTWNYLKAVSRGKNLKKVEKTRTDLAKSLQESSREVKRMKPFEGDASLKNMASEHLLIYFRVMNEDYAKLVDMEEIAEQSFDQMEAYILLKEKANEKLSESSSKLDSVYHSFATTHGVKIQEGGASKKEEKIKQASEVLSYYNKVFLIFFKSFKQEGYVYESFNKKDVNGLEQNRNYLLTVCAEGMDRLKEVKPYKGDHSLKIKCQKVLEHLTLFAQKDVEVMIDYLLEDEKFSKIESTLNAKNKSDRTKEEIDRYNQAVDTKNKSGVAYNNMIGKVSSRREKVYQEWETKANDFMKKYTP